MFCVLYLLFKAFTKYFSVGLWISQQIINTPKHFFKSKRFFKDKLVNLNRHFLFNSPMSWFVKLSVIVCQYSQLRIGKRSTYQ